METVIIVGLFTILGFVLTLKEGRGLFRQEAQRLSGLQNPEGIETGSGYRELCSGEKNDPHNLLDFSGGTLGI